MLYSTTVDESFVLSGTKTKYKRVLFMCKGAVYVPTNTSLNFFLYKIN